MSTVLTRTIEIVNEKGLHARAAAKLVELAERHSAKATVIHQDLSAAADSIMGLLMLAASKGTSIELQVKGADAEACMTAITDLIANKFGEER